MPEKRMPEEPLCTVTSGAQGRGFDPHGRRSFSAIFFKARDNDDIVVCLLSLGCIQIFVVVAIELL